MELVNFARAQQLIEKQVERAGADFVYIVEDREDGNCNYVHGKHIGEKVPGCIIGHVLADLGVSLEWLASKDFDGNPEGTGYSFGEISHKVPGVAFTQRAANYLRHVQINQDGGEQWGTAAKGIRSTPSVSLDILDDEVFIGFAN